MPYMHEKACPRCKAAYPTKPEYFGSDVECAFVGGVFSRKNWQCATMLKLRDESVLKNTSDLGEHTWNQDENAVILPDGEGNFLVMTWYKRRGATQFALWLEGATEPQTPTLENAERVIAWAECKKSD